MDLEAFCAQTSIDSFCWQYSFYAYLIFREAPASEEQLYDLAQAVHALRGHGNPIEEADLVLRTWPFDLKG
jgi:hypothetical protein